MIGAAFFRNVMREESGVNLIPFKPHFGGHWTQFATFREGLVRRILLSSDIIELEQAARSGIPLEILELAKRNSGHISAARPLVPISQTHGGLQHGHHIETLNEH
jgi:hypothetical protein